MSKYLLVVEDGEFTQVRRTESEQEVDLLTGKAIIYLEPDWWDACDEGFWFFASRAMGGISVAYAQSRVLRERATLMAGIE